MSNYGNTFIGSYEQCRDEFVRMHLEALSRITDKDVFSPIGICVESLEYEHCNFWLISDEDAKAVTNKDDFFELVTKGFEDYFQSDWDADGCEYSALICFVRRKENGQLTYVKDFLDAEANGYYVDFRFEYKVTNE